MLFLALVVGVTGILESFYYIPTPEQAGTSIQALTFLVPFGGLVRNLHFWSAQLLVVVCALHLLRVILTGAYGPPRIFNYLLGLGLLVLALLLDFTGYVLRWDEGIHWAMITGTNLVRSIPWAGDALYAFLVGGSQPGTATLLRFFGWHVFGLTLAGAILVTWHVFRVRRDGGISAPPQQLRRERLRITRYELAHREVQVMLLAGSGLLMLSIFFPAPLEAPLAGADAVVSGTSCAPWFFLWVQQMLRLGDPFLWGVLVPSGVLLLLALLPYILPLARPKELGSWFPRGNRFAQVLILAIALTIAALTVLPLFNSC